MDDLSNRLHDMAAALAEGETEPLDDVIELLREAAAALAEREDV